MKSKQPKKESKSTGWADYLDSEQRSRIDEGLEDIKMGRTVSSEEFWAKYGRKVSNK